MNKILESYQIKVTKYIDGSYVKTFFNNETDLVKMSYKIMCGYNQNEVIFVPKGLGMAF